MNYYWLNFVIIAYLLQHCFLRSYLLNRSQRVLTRNPLSMFSSPRNLPSISQDSILGLLFFSVYW